LKILIPIREHSRFKRIKDGEMGEFLIPKREHGSKSDLTIFRISNFFENGGKIWTEIRRFSGPYHIQIVVFISNEI